MPLPLIPAAILLLGGFAAYRVKKKKGIMSPERKLIYETALATEKDASKLRVLSETFRKEGCTAEADVLLQRAELREKDPQTLEIYRSTFAKAMAEKNPKKVAAVASAFRKVGATGAAADLSKYGAGLSAAIAAGARMPRQNTATSNQGTFTPPTPPPPPPAPAAPAPAPAQAPSIDAATQAANALEVAGNAALNIGAKAVEKVVQDKINEAAAKAAANIDISGFLP